MKRTYRRKRQEETEINITAFLNLMVVLIPFLLITAVFSQMTVLDIALPNDEEIGKQSAVQARIIIRKKYLEVGDVMNGPLKIIPKTNNGYDFKKTNFLLKEIKRKHPSIRNITLLLEDDIDYEFLIQAMDHARYFNKMVNGQQIKAELFPAISIGSAPALDSIQGKQGAGA